MIFLILIIIHSSLIITRAEPVGRTELPITPKTLSNTRRILGGHEVGDTRPYMVYLRPAPAADPQMMESNWLCSGVIIHERYILTSAACIENVKHFYVVSGTYSWVPVTTKDDACVKNGAKKAVWKCVPKSYFFDGDEFDNIRWMADDIAVVKVEDDFNFERRVKGCDFIPKKIAFNNQSQDLEKPRTVGTVAGWGSTDAFVDPLTVHQSRTTAENSPVLLETDVMLISKKNCKRRWEPQYHYIIDGSMICSKDAVATDPTGKNCFDPDGHCKDLVYTEDVYEDDDEAESPTRKLMVDPKDMQVHTAAHVNDTRRTKIASGGFCENDHGGPLIVGQGKTAVVVGVISACMTRDITHKCYGPFLYTSVWKNREFINCAIIKEMSAPCGALLRSTNTQMIETLYNWDNHPAGPAKDQDTVKTIISRKFNPRPLFRRSESHPNITTNPPRQPCVQAMFVRLHTLTPCDWD